MEQRTFAFMLILLGIAASNPASHIPGLHIQIFQVVLRLVRALSMLALP